MDTLETIWEDSRAYLRRMLISMVKDIDLAEDLLQETYLLARNGLPSFRGDNAQAWLATIAKRCALAHLRKAHVRAEIAIQPDDAFAADNSVGSCSHVEQMLVRRAIEELSPALRQTLLLKHYGDLSYPEIARQLGCPIGTAKRRVWTAIRQLRSILNVETKEIAKMKCSDIRLLDYVCEMLTGKDKEELEVHLSSCETCRTAVEDARNVIAGLNSVRDYESIIDVTEIHPDGSSTTYGSRVLENTSSRPLETADWWSMKYHTWKSVLLAGEEVSFESIEPSEADQNHYSVRFPQPLVPGQSAVFSTVYTTPQGVGAAFDIGFGRWVAVPDNSALDNDHMLIQVVALPKGAKIIGALPEPHETKPGARPMIIWKRFVPKGEAKERPVVVYKL